MSRRRKKKESRQAEKPERAQKASRGGSKTEETRKPPSKGDRIFWYILPIVLLFVASMRFARAVPSPWAEILAALQFICPVAIVIVLWKAFPHPIQSMNKKLAAERAELRRQQKRKKKKAF